MITRIERYLLQSFALPFIFNLLALASLWIIADLFGTLDDFLEHKTPLARVISYYTAQLPLLTYTTLPIALLFAILYSLNQLRRRQELTAILACGIPITTLARPYLLLSVGATTILYLFQQSLIPESQAVRRAILDEIRSRNRDDDWLFNLILRDPEKDQIWFFGRFHRRDHYAESVEILQRHNGRDLCKYFARRASWDGQSWHLQEVKTLHYSPQNATNQESWDEQLSVPTLTLNPHTILLTKTPAPFLTNRDLQHVIDIHTRTHHPDRFLYMTEYAFRYTALFIPLIFSTAAFVAGFAELASRRPINVTAAIFILLAYWLIQELSRAMGSSGRFHPYLAAALPVILFLSLASMQFYCKIIRA
ncbi:MAG: LptF/LptG family permease [Methylacidiphilales bacterium]|nr:LptF/LptG family permease [Candidatus Methylacidiphilales bacterium]MDW8349357.1 LptF/LptG family permease [Verrucomicrobiae bacterium]